MQEQVKILEEIDLSWIPGYCSGKGFTCQCRKHKRCKFDSWVRKIPGEGTGSSLQYSCLKIPRTEEPGGLQSVEL